MNTTAKAATFLALTFLISWSAAIGGWAMKLAESPPGATATLFAMMSGPAIAAVLCAFAFEKGRRREALGLVWRPGWWWLGAWLIGLLLAAASVGLTLLLGGSGLGDLAASVISAAQANGATATMIDQLRAMGPALGWLILAQAAVLGSWFNAPVLTFTEELGWRGYLHSLWRPAGFWRASLGTGFVWGVWHAPAILLFGHNYPEHRALGTGLFVVFCMLLSPLMTALRERAGSVIVPGILHGTINAMGGVTLLALSDPRFPWSGLVGVGGFLALAFGLAAAAVLRGRPEGGGRS